MCPFPNGLKWEPTREGCHHWFSKNTPLTLFLVININILGGHHKKWRLQIET